MDVKLDIKEIMKILPHRYPFLLVDRILEFEEGRRAVGIKGVTMNEAHFLGHFPGMPVMPGVLIVEAMAQVGGIIFLSLPEAKGKLAFFAGIDKIRFRKPVVPGDQLRIEAEVIKIRGVLAKMKVSASVNGEIAAEGELMCSLVDRESSGSVNIHPTAIINPGTIIGLNVTIGPHVVIGENVVVGDNTVIDANAVIYRNTTIGKGNKIHTNAVIGNPPQDLRYIGESNRIVIGDNNTIREFATVHLPVGEGAVTSIGNDNFIMHCAHIAHNCHIANNVIMAGYAAFSGHATIDDQVVMGGMAGVHQFVRIGKMAMVGGHTKIVQDVPPYMLIDGNPAQVRAVNIVGLQRRGVSSQAQTEIKKAFKILYRSDMFFSKAIEELKKKLLPMPETKYLIDFLSEKSKRGITLKSEEIAEQEAEELIFPEIPELGI